MKDVFVEKIITQKASLEQAKKKNMPFDQFPIMPLLFNNTKYK